MYVIKIMSVISENGKEFHLSRQIEAVSIYIKSFVFRTSSRNVLRIPLYYLFVLDGTTSRRVLVISSETASMRFTKFSFQVIFILCAGSTLFHIQIWLFGKCEVNNVCECEQTTRRVTLKRITPPALLCLNVDTCTIRTSN